MIQPPWRWKFDFAAHSAGSSALAVNCCRVKLTIMTCFICSRGGLKQTCSPAPLGLLSSGWIACGGGLDLSSFCSEGLRLQEDRPDRLERKRGELESEPALGRLWSLAGRAAEHRASQREQGEERKTGSREEGLPGTQLSCLETAQKGSGTGT